MYTIAVDFDGTLVKNAFPDISKAEPTNVNHMLIQRAKNLHMIYNVDVKLILWTCREDLPEGSYLTDAIDYCREVLNLEFDAVNENPWSEWQQKYPDKVRKIVANEYWDDRAFNPTDPLIANS